MLELDRGNAASVVEVLRKKLGSAGRAQPATGHLDGLNWEVMVVEDKRVNMWCYPAGKIVVPTGFLQVFRTDAELATMIAHEVGLFAQWADACVLWDCSPENSNQLIVALLSFLRSGTSLRGTGQRRSSTGSVFPNPSGCPSSEGIFTCIYINFLCWLSNTRKKTCQTVVIFQVC
jgi:hypothetical protein